MCEGVYEGVCVCVCVCVCVKGCVCVCDRERTHLFSAMDRTSPKVPDQFRRSRA